MGSVIRSVGVYCPERILTNEDLVKILAASDAETSNEWIVQRTGIIERRIAAPGETNQTMAVEATKNCLEKLVSSSDIPKIEHIIVATNTPQRLFPDTAMYVAGEISRIMPGFIADSAAGYDPLAGCGGINLAFQQADALILAGFYDAIEVIGTEHLSYVTDYSNRETCILFGDGAASHLFVKGEKEDEGHGFIGHYTKGNPEGQVHITCEEDQEKVSFYDAIEAVESGSKPRRTRGREIYKKILVDNEPKGSDEVSEFFGRWWKRRFLLE